jgi:phosphate transport system substrate-binding protein
MRSFTSGDSMKLKLLRTLITGLALAGAAVSVFAQDATGAGATFPAPLYARWAADYQKATGARINFQSVGSGAGLRQIRGKTIDFGASDMPLTDEELAKDGLIQFPTVIGGVVPLINVRGIETRQLRLTGPVLADIFLAKIKRWNDPAIAALNPNLKLPDAAIAPVRRADGSGTTFLFTNYLSKVSPEWKAKVGEGTAVNWPAGAGGKGNEGVSAFVQRLPNSIGFVEYAYAKQNKMPYALLQNAAGNFVAPEDETFAAAAEGAAWDKTSYQVLTDQKHKNAWPITGATFILMHKQQDKPQQAANALKFFDWAFKNGDKVAAELDYVPLPEVLKNAIRKQWAAEVRGPSGQIVFQP